MHHIRICGLSLALLLMLGCSRDEDAGTATLPGAPVAAAAAQESNQAALAALDIADLRERAAQALREDSMYAPAGRNAVEYYLALRDKDPDQPGIRSALVDLQPYVLIANEQAIVSGRLDDARRLIALLTRMDHAAPALPRLQQSLAAAEATLAADEQQALQDAETLAAAKKQSEQQAGQAAQEAERATATRLASSDRSRADPPAEDGAAAGRATASATAAAPAPAGAAVRTPESAAATPTDTRAVAIPAPPPAAATPAALPRLLKEVAPKYPTIALGRGVEGSVEVSFTIGPDGSVSGARAVSSRPARVFDKAALTAVSQWRFEATGRSVTTTRTVNFSLADQG